MSSWLHGRNMRQFSLSQSCKVKSLELVSSFAATQLQDEEILSANAEQKENLPFQKYFIHHDAK